MRLVKTLGVALVAVFAFGAMVATGASAHSFEASAAGLLLLGSAEGPHLFLTKAGHLSCNTLKAHGVVTTTPTLTQLVTASYEGCTAIAKGISVLPDEPIVEHYIFNADGTVTLAETTIRVLGIFPCTILVLAQGPLGTIVYHNVNSLKEILLLAHVPNILNSATGSGCNEQYTHSNTGLYIGNALVKVDGGGTIMWV